MAKKQVKREEVDKKYQWDLTPIFKNDNDFYTSLENIKRELPNIQNFKGKIVKNGKNLYDFLTFHDNLERKIYKLYYYAHLNYDSDTTNTEYQKMDNFVSDLLANYDNLSSFVNPEMMEVDYKTILKFYEEEPKLKEYEFCLQDFYRYKKHILTHQEEYILSLFTKTFSNAEKTYSCLVDSDIKFGMIKDEKNEDVELTGSNYTIYIRSSDRKVREMAFKRIHETYAGMKNTITSTFKGNIDVLTSMAKLKKYDSSLQASLFDDNVSTDVYENLIDTVHKNMNIIHEYYQLKKEVLGLEELHLYDIYLELIKDYDKEYTFEEAKTLVLNSLSVLGASYQKTLQKAFDEKWIDVYNNVGKRGGAYSSGFYDTHPYILLNYEGKFNDVSTLAHELGHSMHTYYSCQKNPYQYSSYQIFVAEVASTVNELLLNNYMYQHSQNKEEKLFLLNELLELFKGTIYRQTMFAEFERDMHRKVENGEALTEEIISNHYYELNKMYFGENVVVDDLIRYEWERIPHFYYDFYVYKYAIGLSCACYIVHNILNKKENALESYLKFLSSGGSDYPINELKIAGVDVTKPEVIESALDMFQNTIDEFKKIYRSK